MTAAVQLTNKDVAAQLGVHFTTVSKYRNGTRTASTRVCSRISTAYRIRLADVIEAASASPEAFGELMRARVFHDE